MTKLSDREIIIKIKAGEIDCFSYIVKKYSDQINKIIKARLFDKSYADDLTQNTFIKFYKAINRFDEKKSIKPYLCAIAVNELKMYFRSHRTTRQLNESIIDESKNWQMIINQDEYNLSQLSGQQQKALQMVIDGSSYKEIAKAIGRPLNTVKTIIRRARLIIEKNSYEKTGR